VTFLFNTFYTSVTFRVSFGDKISSISSFRDERTVKGDGDDARLVQSYKLGPMSETERKSETNLYLLKT